MPAATPKREAVRARMLETVWLAVSVFGYHIFMMSFGGLCDRAVCFCRVCWVSQEGGELTRALWPTLSPTMGLSASSRSSSMIMTEDKMSSHGFVCVEWRLGATWVAYVIGG